MALDKMRRENQFKDTNFFSLVYIYIFDQVKKPEGFFLR